MVFERKSYTNPTEIQVGSVSGIINNYNNTNASGYINRIRFRRLKEQYDLCDGCVYHNDAPPN